MQRVPNPYHSRSPSPSLPQPQPPHPGHSLPQPLPPHPAHSSPQNFSSFPQTTSPIPLKSPSNFLASGFLTNHLNFCETPEKLAKLRAELSELRAEIALLSGMNENKELYIKQLEEKVASLCSENRREGENTYNLRKKEEHYSILLREQKKLFEKKHKDLEEELEKTRGLLRKNADNSRTNLSLTHEIERNSPQKFEELDKTFLETSLKVYKINLKEMHAKIEALNAENGQVSQLFREKCKETQEIAEKLRQSEEIHEKHAKNCEKLLAENKKVTTFNTSLLAELELLRGNSKKTQENHEKHVQELEISWKKVCDTQKEELKSQFSLEKSRIFQELGALRDSFAKEQQKVLEKTQENASFCGKLAEISEKDSQNRKEIELLREKLANSRERCEKLSQELEKLGETAGIVSRNAVLEAANQAFSAKIACFEEERRSFQAILGEKAKELCENREKVCEFEAIVEKLRRKLAETEEKAAKCEKIESHVRELLQENARLNEISKKLLCEAEVFETKLAKIQQNCCEKLQENELALRKSLHKAFEEERAALIAEIRRILQENEALSSEKNAVFCENTALLMKLEKIEQNHELQLSELSAKIKTNFREMEEDLAKIEENRRDLCEKQRVFQENAREFAEEKREFFEKQQENCEKLAVFEQTLRFAREKLLQFHGEILEFQRKACKTPGNAANFSRTLEESEKTLFILQDVLRNSQKNASFSDKSLRFASFLEETSAITRDFAEKNAEIDQLINFEREHSRCYQELRRELCETRDNFAKYRENSEKQLGFLEKELQKRKKNASFLDENRENCSQKPALREISANFPRKPTFFKNCSKNEALNEKILRRCREILH